MKPRLVLVTRRFWPLVGGAERQMASLAAELKRLGCDVTILTAHWEPRWPEEISHHGVRVVRLPNPTMRGWGTVRYMLSVGRWLRDHRGDFDLVYVSSLRHAAFAAISERDLDAGVPVVLRSDGTGRLGDGHWQREATFGGRIAKQCQKADAVVAPSPAVENELLAAGFTNIERIDNGVALPSTISTAEQRAAARTDLARANPELTVAESAPVAVYTGRLHEVKGLDTLLAAWQIVLREQPRARLWLVGEGPQQRLLASQIEKLRLRRRVMLAGTFDDVDQFLRAADLFVLPASEEGTSLALLEAMAAGLPIVATDIPGNRHILSDSIHADQADSGDGSESPSHHCLVTPGKVEPLANAILQSFDDPATAERLGTAARRRVGEAFSIAKMAEQHLELFNRLIANSSPPDTP